MFSFLEDGRILGRIHTRMNSSVTAVGLISDQGRPFILAGHGNGSVTWYGAHCGTWVSTTYNRGAGGQTNKIQQTGDDLVLFQVCLNKNL